MTTTTSRKRSTSLLAGRSPELSRPVAKKAKWTDLDVRAVDTVRVLAADAVHLATELAGGPDDRNDDTVVDHAPRVSAARTASPMARQPTIRQPS